MIEREIKVTYYHNNKTGEWCKDAPAKYDEDYYNDFNLSEYRDYDAYKKDSNDPTLSPNRKRFWNVTKRVFHKFTNTGKLSKTELKNLPENEVKFFKDDAEKQLAQILKLEESTKADTEKALKLVDIVNSANWDNLNDKDFAVIKVKNSHSSWYKGGLGEMHAPSEYLTVVPVAVAKEAKELQNIRRKHQGDSTFDFAKTNYRTREVRVSDHDNQDSFADVDAVNEDWTKIFNCNFI